jgi:pimeloyl-ACP methyl ester carboxylesterase
MPTRMRTRTTSPPRRALVLLISAFFVFAAACSDDEAAPISRPEGSRVVRFPAVGGGPVLEGTLSGRGKVGVVLAHQANADQSAWYPFAAELASQRYEVLTFNFRGFCPGEESGCSPGKFDPPSAPEDLEGAVAFLEDQGVDKLFVVGASMGGTAALVPLPLQIDGIVAVSAPEEFRGLQARPAGLRKIPTLFIAGRGDPGGAAEAAQSLYERAPDPKQILLVSSEAHGAFLLDDPDTGAEVEQAILDFLGLYRDAA